MSEAVAASVAAVDLINAKLPPDWLGAEADTYCVATADAMPVEIVQFCWQYNLERLQKLPEVRWMLRSKLHASED